MSAFLKFDVDAEIQKLGCPPANPANPANPTPERDEISGISKISRGTLENWDSSPLAEVAKAHSLTLTELKEAAGPDWPEVEADPKLAEALAHAVQTRRMRERGEVPPHYTAGTVRAGCGPVPIWEGAPEKVLACPWCFNRVAR